VGIGVDESTSIVVEQGRRFVVEGESQVVVVRARDGVVETTAIGPGGSHELA
jgi:cyanophycinase-like exopeptidase